MGQLQLEANPKLWGIAAPVRASIQKLQTSCGSAAATRGHQNILDYIIVRVGYLRGIGSRRS